MKNFLIKTFFKEKFMGQAAAALAALAASWLISLLPNAPEFVTTVVGLVMDLPTGDVITQENLMAFLTVSFMWGINAVVQQFVAKDNNLALQALKADGRYSGPLDSWIGPKALEGISSALLEIDDSGLNRRL
jgi:hypothetical protein